MFQKIKAIFCNHEFEQYEVKTKSVFGVYVQQKVRCGYCDKTFNLRNGNRIEYDQTAGFKNEALSSLSERRTAGIQENGRPDGGDPSQSF